ncbi:MAG: hypothetical protein M3Q68_03735, partial [Actinomycetota bacterium]|nr:hypothetical protein [Actinomycetota bacterium]
MANGLEAERSAVVHAGYQARFGKATENRPVAPPSTTPGLRVDEVVEREAGRTRAVRIDGTGMTEG